MDFKHELGNGVSVQGEAADDLGLPTEDGVFLFDDDGEVNDEFLEEEEEIGYGENLGDPEGELEMIYIKINEKLQEASEILSEEQLSKLKDIWTANVKAFGITKSGVRLSRLLPVECHLLEDHPPILAKPRPMSGEKMEFSRNYINELVEVGLLELERDPLYSSNVFVVPKKGAKKYRLVIDLRQLNTWTRRTGLVMPNLEDQLQRLAGSKVFGSVDLLSGFDYLPIAKTSMKYFCIITPWGSAYRLTGCPQGWCNSPCIFTERVINENWSR